MSIDDMKKELLQFRLDTYFGDGLEEDYCMGGFPDLPGLNTMTDEEIIEEYNSIQDDESEE